MKDFVQKKINQWHTEGDIEVLSIGDQIDYLNKMLFSDYEPSIGPKPDFNSRLKFWLKNVSLDHEQKLLFKLVPKLFYVGKNEFDVLYRVAYSTNTIKWLIDIENLSLDQKIEANLNLSLKKTWFCPITDSMRINQFYHLNEIAGADKRPEWRSLEAFGSKERIQDYLTKNNFTKIVLLEDFVGSGNQIKKTIEFAASSFAEYDFLIVPILMCPKAWELLSELQVKYKNITINPVLELHDDLFIENGKKDNFNKSIKSFSKKYHKEMKKKGFKWSYLGFRNLGGLIVLHTNTPNNSLPIIWSNFNWSPLFNRHVR